MFSFTMTTTGRQIEFSKNLIERHALGKIPGTAEKMHQSFDQQLKTLPASKEVTVYVTNLKELFELNGLPYKEAVETEGTKSANIAVPNFLAELQGLEPLGQELALEVYGQGLHVDAIAPVHAGYVICSIKADQEVERNGLYDAYCGRAIRLEQKKHGDCAIYPITHIARYQERMMILYVKKGTAYKLAR